MLEKMESKDAKADTIRTKAVSELRQKRFDDPLLYQEFSERIRKTLADYEENRNADKYLENMEIIADDLRNGRTNSDYPSKIESDSDAKAFYGAMFNIIKNSNIVDLSLENEEILGDVAVEIKEKIKHLAKRDWRHNVAVHKQMHRCLDDSLFNLFEMFGIDCNIASTIDLIDNIIEEIMKVALARY